MKLTFFNIIKLIVWVVFIDCIGVGLLIASVYWFLTNKFLLKNKKGNHDVEWAYCFDVHLNAFLPLLIILHFFQLPFLMSNTFFCHLIKTYVIKIINYSFQAIIDHDWYVSSIISNTFWLVAISYYFYNLFLGFSGMYLF
jgi:hypothetical protein